MLVFSHHIDINHTANRLIGFNLHTINFCSESCNIRISCIRRRWITYIYILFIGILTEITDQIPNFQNNIHLVSIVEISGINHAKHTILDRFVICAYNIRLVTVLTYQYLIFIEMVILWCITIFSRAADDKLSDIFAGQIDIGDVGVRRGQIYIEITCHWFGFVYIGTGCQDVPIVAIIA